MLPFRKSRREMLQVAAAGAAGVVGVVLFDGDASAAPSTVNGPTGFKSTTSKTAVTVSNTSTGNAIAATSNRGTTVHATHEGAGVGAAAVRATALGTATAMVASAAKGEALNATASGSASAITAKAATGTALDASTSSTDGGATAIVGTVASKSPGGSSAGVLGQNNGTGGLGIGVYGSQAGSGWGVYGTTPSGIGMYGYSGAGTGVQGGSSTGPAVSATSTSGIGVDGHSTSNAAVRGTSGSAAGVMGSSTSGYGVEGVSSTTYGVAGVTTTGNGVYGQATADAQAGVVGRQENASGNYGVYSFGNIGATGTKSAVVEASDGKGHMTLYCMESPECWFEDFGTANLTKGQARIAIDPEFAQTIDTEHYNVFLQPEGDCNGLYVHSKTSTGFAVAELGAGKSDVRFCYRIVAIRANVTAPRLYRTSLPDAPRRAAL
jgi:hypothetical protein